MTYSVHRVDGHGMSVSDLRIRPTGYYEVRWSDGTVAFRTRSAYAEHGRALAGLRMHAQNVSRRYQAYFDRTGKRWEIEHKGIKDAERELAKRRKRLAWLRENVPRLAAELALLEREETPPDLAQAAPDRI